VKAANIVSMPWASILKGENPYLDKVIDHSPALGEAVRQGVVAGRVRLPVISSGDEEWLASEKDTNLLEAALILRIIGDKLLVMSLDAFQKLRAAVVIASQA